MREVLAEQRANGTAISSLYPATVPLYHQMGYGFGGVRTFWRARLDHLPDDRSTRTEPFDDGAVEELDAAYRAIARDTNGLVERTPDWWRARVLRDDDNEPRYRYLVREDGRITGWIVYKLTSQSDSWRSMVTCRDLFWTTPRAAAALLSLAALHRSTSEKIEWTGPPVETLGDLTREDVAENSHAFRYMIRLLDVPAAFEARGYHPLVETEFTIGVDDPLFADNAGPWRVRVSGGGAKVAPADDAEARATVQTWASIWSSLLSPRDAVRQGRLQASERALDALTLAFAGPIPWIADFY
jgi:predicted acetyltransferase